MTGFLLSFLTFYIFMIVLGLHCFCVWAFSSCGVRGYSLVALPRPLIVVPSLVAERRLCAQRSSVVEAHELSCSAACGIFPGWGRTPVTCITRWILNLWTTREASYLVILLWVEKGSKRAGVGDIHRYRSE